MPSKKKAADDRPRQPRVRIAAKKHPHAGREGYLTGETATLALTPAQAEIVTHAQKVGQISLSLRSLADMGRTADAAPEARADSGMTIVRFGVSKQQSRH